LIFINYKYIYLIIKNKYKFKFIKLFFINFFKLLNFINLKLKIYVYDFYEMIRLLVYRILYYTQIPKLVIVLLEISFYIFKKPRCVFNLILLCF